ncbi:hypothetical protein yc1106_07197 [Curvularia clavata]|uniref:Uncharacterized protein n=1 Tax=Curvularia clavata TaxID=95742 RepID=A0A9Q8ZGU2_CURCL|nr:hypothetical protein yc1106_07197 [Curvularia clavata]
MAARPTEHQRVASHGRGGAVTAHDLLAVHTDPYLQGNIAKDDPTNYPKPEDLVTPTLKGDTYTTGRGGQGNMARNDREHPEIARAAQDVEGSPQPETQGPKHYGRGGAANIINNEAATQQRNSEETKREEKGLLGKGKGLLNKLGKK